MVDIRLLKYEEADSLSSLAQTDANGDSVVVLATIVGPVLGLYLWRKRRRPIISGGSA
jgi:hypothetical protein